MNRLLFWIVVLGLLFYGYKAGWFDSVVNYFVEADKYGRQEKVIHEADGTVTTVKYRNFFDIITGK